MSSFHTPHQYVLDADTRNLDPATDPAVATVDSILYRAFQASASDVHLQPTAHVLRIRFRIDGQLYDQEPLKNDLSSLVVARLKVLAQLDSAQRRLPQDGKIGMCIKDNDTESAVDLRVATFPTIYGEKVVIRFLCRSMQFQTFEQLGMNAETSDQVSAMLEKQHGLILVTGPTGSGKTTTLYSMLSKINDSGRNIVTLEDPVECYVRGLSQSQVHNQIGFAFSQGLRCLLRQDPDVIMIGEIRDIPTAQIAVEAALTGHLVLSSLHTSSAAGAVTRLLDMGIEPFLLSASLIGVVAQRLARLLCASCKKVQATSFAQHTSLVMLDCGMQRVSTAPGCDACQQRGYRGRTGLFEVLTVNDQLAELILQRRTSHEFEQEAVEQTLQTFRKDAIEKLKAGLIGVDDYFIFAGK